MAWEQIDTTIVFECDSCSETVECDIGERRREDASDSEHDTDFAVCFRHLLSIGWKSFKRVGHAWSYHCADCAAEAEREHQVWRRNEDARERQKARNAS